jgi:hypothetical protein
MQSKRKAKISGEIILGEDCNFDDLVKDIFTCFEKYDAQPDLMIYEIQINEEEVHHKTIKDIMERALEKAKR